MNIYDKMIDQKPNTKFKITLERQDETGGKTIQYVDSKDKKQVSYAIECMRMWLGLERTGDN